MDKSIIRFVIIVIIIAITIVGIVLYRNSNKNNNNDIEEKVPNSRQEKNSKEENTQEIDTNNVEKESTPKSESKILVVYYSAQNHTKSVAEKIAKNLNADIFEIVPEKVYSNADLDWTNSNSRVSREHNDESLREVKLKNTKVNNWNDYDTVLIGYPIWWGEAAWPVASFVKANNFDGKTVIPFCTSASSSLGQSGKLLQKEANLGNWLDGKRFSSSTSDSEIKKWTDSLK